MNLSQTQLAAKLLVSFQAVSNWERGITPPDLENLCKLSVLFGTSLDALMGSFAADSERIMIGVDGGGTKTEFILFTESGKVLRRLKLPQSNPSNIGFENCFSVLSEGIDILLDAVPRVDGIFAGMAGTLSSDNANKVRSYLKTHYKNIPTFADSDAVNVLLSGKNASGGMALICGTGSVLFVRENGKNYRFGGWGSLFDDAGSAYNIGCGAVKAALRFLDGVGEQTVLSELLTEYLGDDLVNGSNLCYERGKAFVASLAPTVFTAYAKGDKVAQDILQQNADELALLINSARKRYGNLSEVVACGGIFENNHAVFEPMIRRKLDRPLHFIYPQLPPVYGACVACCRELKITADEAFYRNFYETYRSLQCSDGNIKKQA